MDSGLPLHKRGDHIVSCPARMAQGPICVSPNEVDHLCYDTMAQLICFIWRYLFLASITYVAAYLSISNVSVIYISMQN